MHIYTLFEEKYENTLGKNPCVWTKNFFHMLVQVLSGVYIKECGQGVTEQGWFFVFDINTENG